MSSLEMEENIVLHHRRSLVIETCHENQPEQAAGCTRRTEQLSDPKTPAHAG
jgi:hypothetical protein